MACCDHSYVPTRVFCVDAHIKSKVLRETTITTEMWIRQNRWWGMNRIEQFEQSVLTKTESIANPSVHLREIEIVELRCSKCGHTLKFDETQIPEYWSALVSGGSLNVQQAKQLLLLGCKGNSASQSKFAVDLLLRDRPKCQHEHRFELTQENITLFIMKHEQFRKQSVRISDNVVEIEVAQKNPGPQGLALSVRLMRCRDCGHRAVPRNIPFKEMCYKNPGTVSLYHELVATFEDQHSRLPIDLRGMLKHS